MPALPDADGLLADRFASDSADRAKPVNERVGDTRVSMARESDDMAKPVNERVGDTRVSMARESDDMSKPVNERVGDTRVSMARESGLAIVKSRGIKLKTQKKKLLILFMLTIGFLMLTGFAPGKMIVNSRAILRQGPSIRSAKLGTLEAGEIVRVTAADSSWYEIAYGEEVAYVKQNYLTAIPWKINALGDSMTAGAVVQDKNNLYFNVVGILCGAQESRNYGANGTTIAGIMPTNFVDRSMFMEKDANLVLVLGGTNDFYYNIPLGTDADRNYFTFYGAVHMLCSRLKTVYPDSDIVFMTPLHRADEFGEINQNGNTLEEYAQVILQVCGEYGIPVIDLYHEQRLNFGTNKELFMPDGLHPDDLGQMAIGYYVAEQLKELGIVYGEMPTADGNTMNEMLMTVPAAAESGAVTSAGDMTDYSLRGDGWTILDSTELIDR